MKDNFGRFFFFETCRWTLVSNEGLPNGRFLVVRLIIFQLATDQHPRVSIKRVESPPSCAAYFLFVLPFDFQLSSCILLMGLFPSVSAEIKSLPWFR